MLGFKRNIVAITTGVLKDISVVSDPMFAEKMMGDGIAIESDSDEITVCAPSDGTLSVLFPTGHAFGVTMKNGIELLVHIGINTVEANGAGFEVLAKQGQRVKAGDEIVKVSLKQLKEKYEMPVMMIVTDSKGNDIKLPRSGVVKQRDVLLEI